MQTRLSACSITSRRVIATTTFSTYDIHIRVVATVSIRDTHRYLQHRPINLLMHPPPYVSQRSTYCHDSARHTRLYSRGVVYGRQFCGAVLATFRAGTQSGTQRASRAVNRVSPMSFHHWPNLLHGTRVDGNHTYYSQDSLSRAPSGRVRIGCALVKEWLSCLAHFCHLTPRHAS